MPQQRWRLYAGFTLIEVMVSLVIVGVLALAAVPVVRHLLIQGRLSAAAEGLASQLRLARSEAIQRQQTVYVHLQSGTSWCYGSNVGSDCVCSPSSTCGLSTVSGDTYPSVVTSVSGFSGGAISLDSSRGLVSEASSVTFTIGSRSILLTLSRLGLVSLCSTDVSGYPAC